MDFGWTAAQQERYERILSATRQWPARPAGASGNGHFTQEGWRRCGELGLLGLSLPPHYGGQGFDALTTARMVEAFARGQHDMGLVFAAMAHLFACAMPISEYGTDEVQARFLPRLSSGEWVAANAITEEQAGSDVSALRTRAVRARDGYVLTGTKSWVSNGPVADVFVVYAITDPSLGHLGSSAFVVERDRPGVIIGEPFAKMGLSSCPAGELRLDGCQVPAGNRLGLEGQGGAIFQHSMRWERSCLFASYVGMMDRLLERCVMHAKERRQFGRSIACNQAISHRLADMKLRLEAARLLLYQACWTLDQGERSVLEVSLAKVAVSEAAIQASLDAIQIFGSAGYATAMGIEQALRDSVPSTIFSGTSEIQRELIVKELGL
jgi:alkylation response protein AidB-like acyl-CoA dehydrogenase